MFLWNVLQILGFLVLPYQFSPAGGDGGAAAPAGGGCFDYMFTFGDSLIDTGNFGHMAGPTADVMRPPYGMTYFHHPTGRITDGRVVVDFIAEAFGLPLPQPSMVGTAPEDFPHGANFAVLAATAMNNSHYARWNFTVPGSSSLDVQYHQFKKMLIAMAGSRNFSSVLNRSLIVLGEIGGNDYNFWFVSQRPRKVAYRLVQDVVDYIAHLVEDLIKNGAKAIVVPNNLPIGCVPLYRSWFRDSNTSDYDEHGCVEWFNRFSRYHNQILQAKLLDIRARHRAATVVYANYYKAAYQIYKHPQLYGFDNVFEPCCGSVPKLVPCNGTARVCQDPSKFASWDGLHMTEATYRVIADGVLHGPFAEPFPLQSLCNATGSLRT